MTIERRTTVSKTKLRPSTKTKTNGSQRFIASMKSTLSAVSPPTTTCTFVPRNADQCRARTGLREVAVERLVSLPGLEPVRQSADAAGTEIQAKSWNRKG